MQNTIQDEDSNLILSQEWWSTHTMAVVIACSHLTHLNMKHYCTTFKKGPKALYKQFYSKECDHA